MVFIPLLVLGGIELGLRLGGYGYDTGFFRRIQINGHNFYVPNEKFSYRFFPPAIARTAPPFDLPQRKPPTRIGFFCSANRPPTEILIQLMALADTWKFCCANVIPERIFK